jgi:hypothetical protein
MFDKPSSQTLYINDVCIVRGPVKSPYFHEWSIVEQSENAQLVLVLTICHRSGLKGLEWCAPIDLDNVKDEAIRATFGRVYPPPSVEFNPTIECRLYKALYTMFVKIQSNY